MDPRSAKIVVVCTKIAAGPTRVMEGAIDKTLELNLFASMVSGENEIYLGAPRISATFL